MSPCGDSVADYFGISVPDPCSASRQAKLARPRQIVMYLASKLCKASDPKNEFPELRNAVEYVDRARTFAQKPPAGALTRLRSNGDIVLYDPHSNTLVVCDANRAPRTMFKPDPAKHGYASNLDYFNAQ